MSAEIVRYQPFDEITAIAKTFALTGYFDAKGTNPVEIAKAVTKILAGQEMGFGPFASINGIYIIQGRPSISAGLMAQAVKASPKYDYRVRESTGEVCRIEYFERTAKGVESLGVAVFTLADAKAAGTQNLQKFPADMLFARCMSRGVRRFCPDVFASGSVYTPEELGATVDADGVIVESEAKADEQPAPGNGDEHFGDTGEVASATTLKTFHATGRDLYGKDWDIKRPQLVKFVTKGRAESGKGLTEDEALRLIAGMHERLIARPAAPAAPEPEQAALVDAEPAKVIYP